MRAQPKKGRERKEACQQTACLATSRKQTEGHALFQLLDAITRSEGYSKPSLGCDLPGRAPCTTGQLQKDVLQIRLLGAEIDDRELRPRRASRIRPPGSCSHDSGIKSGSARSTGEKLCSGGMTRSSPAISTRVLLSSRRKSLSFGSQAMTRPWLMIAMVSRALPPLRDSASSGEWSYLALIEGRTQQSCWRSSISTPAGLSSTRTGGR